MITTRKFNILQGPYESLKEYLSRFNKVTTKEIHLNQEIFVGAFQNGLSEWHFNESLAQSPTTSLAEVVTRSEFYIKGEDRKVEKMHMMQKKDPNMDNSRRSHYTLPMRDRKTFKQCGNPTKIFIPLNGHWEQIRKKVLHMHNIPRLSAPDGQL